MTNQISDKRTPLSAFIVCCNEESNIRRCLESVRWCDEIVVIDSGSTDKTLEICRDFNCKIVHRDWTGFVDQKAHGLSHCSHEWVLNLDADEEVSPELREEINQLLSHNSSSGIHGYEILRIVFHLGKWWRKGGWYPEYRLRLCRRGATTWGGEDPHERAIVRGTVRRLKAPIHHYTYSDLGDQVRALNAHSSAAARSLFQRRRSVNLFDLLIRPLARFIKFYVIRKGFLEGREGFLVAILESYYVFLKYAKLWELIKGCKGAPCP